MLQEDFKSIQNKVVFPFKQEFSVSFTQKIDLKML